MYTRQSTIPKIDLQSTFGQETRWKASAYQGNISRPFPSLPIILTASLDVLSVIFAGFAGVFVKQALSNRSHAEFVHATFQNVSVPKASAVYLSVFAIYLLIFCTVYGLYRADRRDSSLREQRMTVQATLTAAFVLCGTLYLFRGYQVSRVSVLLTTFITLALLMTRRGMWRARVSRKYIEGHETRNFLVVGNGRVGQALRTHLEALRHMGFRFKGFVAMDPQIHEMEGTEVVGGIASCVSLARSLFVDEIYFSTPADKATVLAVVDEARTYDINVRVVPDLYDGLAWNAPVEYIGQFPTIPLHLKDFSPGAFLLKRVIDVILSILALTILWPLFLSIAIVIALDSPGPVLYRSRRIGRKGREFSCLKFRTMEKEAESRQSELQHLNERADVLFKIWNDPRITKSGKLLRRYSLDELPQLVNVLRGEMSLVGPRPPTVAEVEKYQLNHLRRLTVLPGITGLWQVEARQDPSFDNYISLDTAYVETWSLLLDLKILIKTCGVVLRGTGT